MTMLGVCQLCRAADLLVRVPADANTSTEWVCAECLEELRESDEDPRENVCDLCGSVGGCNVCNGMSSNIGVW